MRTPSYRPIASLVVFASLTFAAGCHHPKVPPPPPPPPAATSPAPTATITVTPSSISPGGSAVLAWRTTDATDISIDGMGTVNAYGTKNVNPAETTTYHLVARGDGGSTDSSATLTVNAPPPPAASTGNETMDEQAFEQHVKPVFFDYDSYDIRTDAQTVLADDASFLGAHPTIKVVIGGYCDERGSAEYNLALGENRANAAKQALVNGGVSPERIRTVSYGKEKQFCTQADESCYQQNRRAGFSLDQ